MIGGLLVSFALSAGAASAEIDLERGVVLEPRCNGRLRSEVVVPGLRHGLSCLRRIGGLADRHADELESMLRPHRPLRFECDLEERDAGAEARPGPEPRVVLAGGMADDLEAGGDPEVPRSIVFHETLHLLRPEYHHGYVRGMPDVVVGCEICCYADRTKETSYLRREAMTDADVQEQCRVCGEAGFDASLEHRQRMARLAEEDNQHYAFNLLRALGDAGATDEASLRHWLEPVLEPVCRRVAEARGSIDAMPISEPVRRFVRERCPGMSAPAPGRERRPKD